MAVTPYEWPTNERVDFDGCALIAGLTMKKLWVETNAAVQCPSRGSFLLVEYRELYKVRAPCRNSCGYAMLSGRFLAPDLAIRDSRNPAETQASCDWPANELLSCRPFGKRSVRVRLSGCLRGRRKYAHMYVENGSSYADFVFNQGNSCDYSLLSEGLKLSKDLGAQ